MPFSEPPWVDASRECKSAVNCGDFSEFLCNRVCTYAPCRSANKSTNSTVNHHWDERRAATTTGQPYQDLIDRRFLRNGRPDRRRSNGARIAAVRDVVAGTRHWQTNVVSMRVFAMADHRHRKMMSSRMHYELRRLQGNE